MIANIKPQAGPHISEGYMFTPSGVIPQNWASRPLNEITEEITRSAGSDNYETLSISAGIGFVNQADKFGKELSGKQYEKYIVLEQGDFAYNKGNSKTYPQGCIYRLKDRKEAAVPNVFESFRIVEGDANYYEQLFLSGFLNRQLLAKINRGVRENGLLNLTGEDFYSCEVPFPPVQEQEKIAKILAHCDKLIDLCQQKINELKKQKQFFLREMFPQQGSDVPNVRFPEYNGSWEQRKLGELCSSFEYGLNAAAVEYDGANKYIRITDINDDTREFDQTSLTSPDCDLEACSEYRLEEGDIVFARTGASVGKTYSYKQSDGTVYFAGFLIRARILPANNTEFIFQNTLTSDFQKFVQIISQRSGQPGINAQEYASYQLYLPGIEEQIKIGTFLHSIDNLIALQQSELVELQKYKKVLMQLMLTGIVRTK